MKKLLVVIDMQKEFVVGKFGNEMTQAIVPHIKEKIDRFNADDQSILFTLDGRFTIYKEMPSGKYVPEDIMIKGTEGYDILDELYVDNSTLLERESLASLAMIEFMEQYYKDIEEIELCGVFSNTCVISNAVLLKAMYPHLLITVDKLACAGTTEENHQAAIETMIKCNINLL